MSELPLSSRMRKATPIEIAVLFGGWVEEVDKLELDLARMTRANEQNVRALQARQSVKRVRHVTNR